MAQPSDSTPEPSLTQPLQFLTGVGPHRAALLEKLGLRTAADLLFFFPRTYDDFTQLDPIETLESDQPANVMGVVSDIDQTVSSNGKHILYVLIRQGNQFLRAVWFNQSYMLGRFQAGQRVLFRGKPKLIGGRFQMNHPTVVWLDVDQTEDQAGLSPIYRLTDGISQRQIRAIVASAVEKFTDMVQEAFPQELRDQSEVCDIATAIRQIHAPKTQHEVEIARNRLVYQELFVLQLALAIRRQRIRSQNVSPPLDMTPKIRSRIYGRLPFELTESQQSVLQEIAADMRQPFPMNRLIHGEVGSGKTVVALCAMLVAVAHGHQATIMAPTEILARQHFQTLSKFAKISGPTGAVDREFEKIRTSRIIRQNRRWRNRHRHRHACRRRF